MVKTKKDSVDLTNYPIIERLLRKKIERMKTINRLNEVMALAASHEILDQDDKAKLYGLITKLSEECWL